MPPPAVRPQPHHICVARPLPLATPRTLTTLLPRCTACLLLPAAENARRAAAGRGATRLQAWREEAALHGRAAARGCAAVTRLHDIVADLLLHHSRATLLCSDGPGGW